MLTDTVTIGQQLAQQIASLLTDIRATLTRGTVEDWGQIAKYSPQTCPKNVANSFLLCCLLDYQIPTKLAWNNGWRLVQHFSDPDDIWKEITSCTEDEWNAQFKQLHLHRFPAAHDRLWKIGKKMCRYYEGDARTIWNNRDANEVQTRLFDIGVGEQISRMVAGALRDMHYVEGSGDVKADVHVCRVLGRLVNGKTIEPVAATELARKINPSDPWQLDWPLWNIGNSLCHPNNPLCSQCKAKADKLCFYAQEHSLGG
jgi:endonuclease III